MTKPKQFDLIEDFLVGTKSVTMEIIMECDTATMGYSFCISDEEKKL